MKELIKKILKASVVGRKMYPLIQMPYRWVAIPLKRRRLQRSGIDVLYKLHKILSENKIRYYLDYGTLLGIVREGDFIKHDDDIDLTVADMKADAKHILKILLSSGFKFIHALTVKGRIVEFSISFNKLSVDFFFYLPVPEVGKVGECDVYFDRNAKYNSSNQNNYRIWFFPDDIMVKVIQFKGIDVYIPEYPENILQLEYGHGWNVPIKNWKPNDLLDHYKEMDDYAIRITDVNEVLKD